MEKGLELAGEIIQKDNSSKQYGDPNEILDEIVSISRIISRRIDSNFLSQGFNTYRYINGEEPAMQALIEATKRAKSEIRSTRFFPLAIRPNNPEYAEMISNRVLGRNGFKPLERYFRILCANKEEKLDDAIEYVRDFRRCPFVLYLVGYSNDFELVIIDESEVFIHFYGEKTVIASTLHLQGKDVVANFTAVFSRLHEPTMFGREVLKVDCKYITEENLEDKLDEVKEFFAKQKYLRDRGESA